MSTAVHVVKNLGLCKFESGYSHVANLPFDYGSYKTRESDKRFLKLAIGNGYLHADIVNVDPGCPDVVLRLISDEQPDVGIFTSKITDTRYSISALGEYYRFETENGTVWNLWVPIMDEIED